MKEKEKDHLIPRKKKRTEKKTKKGCSDGERSKTGGRAGSASLEYAETEPQAA